MSSELSGAVAGLRISLCVVGGVRTKKLPQGQVEEEKLVERR